MAVADGHDRIVEDPHPRKIVFFDVETTVPFRTGQKFELLEFGAIVLDVQGLSEVHSYDTLIRPKDLSTVTRRSIECNGISKEIVANAPTFTEVADEIFRILNGRIWAGHNIVKFDMLRIREAFSETERQAPEPVGIIDTYPLLRRTFGPRAGNLKLATLANYCGHGKQTHRSLDDVRMNLDVLRSCATMMFLEANYPNIFTTECGVSACTSTMDPSAMLSVSREQIRRSRDDFLPEDVLPSKLSDSLHVEISCSTATRQISQEHIRDPRISFRIKQGGPSEVSESMAESALTIEPSCANMVAQLGSRAMVKECRSPCEMCYTSNPSLSDNDKSRNMDCSDLETLNNGSFEDDELKVYRSLSTMGLADIEIASLEEPRTGYSEVASSSLSCNHFTTKKTEDHGRPLKDDNILVGIETAVLDNSIADGEAEREEICDLPEALLSLSFSDMKDAQDTGALHMSGIEAHSSSSMLPMSDSDLRIAIVVARESFLLSRCVSLDLIELVDENSHFGCKKALYHQGFPLQLWECEIRIRFTINATYAIDDNGKPRFSILIEPSRWACEVISRCEDLVKSNMAAHGEEASWLPSVRNERGVCGVRMSIGTTGIGYSATYTTKFYQPTSNGVKEIALGKVDVAEFRNLLPHRSVIDVGFGFGVFHINNRAGIRLVAKYITIR